MRGKTQLMQLQVQITPRDFHSRVTLRAARCQLPGK